MYINIFSNIFPIYFKITKDNKSGWLFQKRITTLRTITRRSTRPCWSVTTLNTTCIGPSYKRIGSPASFWTRSRTIRVHRSDVRIVVTADRFICLIVGCIQTYELCRGTVGCHQTSRIFGWKKIHGNLITVVYKTNLVITRLRLSSHCRYFLCIILSL